MELSGRGAVESESIMHIATRPPMSSAVSLLVLNLLKAQFFHIRQR